MTSLKKCAEKARKWIKQVSEEVDFVGVRLVCEQSEHLETRNGHIQELQTTMDKGMMVEVLHKGAMCYGATPVLTKEGFLEAFQKAKSSCESLSGHFIYNFDPAVRGSSEGEYIRYGKDDAGALDFLDELLKLDKSLSNRSLDIIDRGVWFLGSKTEIFYLNSLGALVHQKIPNILLNTSVTARKGNEIQTRTNGMPSWQGTLEGVDWAGRRGEASLLLQEVGELLVAPDCPDDVRDLIIDGDQMYLQIHESIGHPLELDRILGDERNYAGWSFVSLEDFGKLQYGSELLNVTFDPGVEGEMASYAFDDGGVAARKVFLIEKGKLLRPLGSLESQKRCDLDGTANFRASSWNRAPIDRMANINLEQGDSSLEEMIAQTEKGVLMRTNRSWSIDDYRNKFQFGCEYAQLIEDGEIREVVKNPNYRGQTSSFWHGLKGVGNEASLRTWGSPYCGKGEPNQAIRVGHRTPACLFSDVHVFGGA